MVSTLSFPARLTLELTNACNYRCAMCPSRIEPGRARGIMAAALFKRIVDQAAERLPVALVPFFRGESLLHPEAVELLAYAKSRGLGPIQLVTNGLLLNEPLAAALLGLGLDFISFSLDTVHPEEYDRIRPGGDFARVMANVEGFLRLRDAGGYATEVQVSATRTGHNAASMTDFVDHWRGRADRTRVYYEHSADGRPGSLDCPEVPREMVRRPCHKPYTDMVVYYDGKVAACNHDWFRPEPLGDLTRQEVAEIWRGPAYAGLRAQHEYPASMTDATCLGCDHWKMYYLDKPFIGELYTPEPEASLVRTA
jgi:radical SAM protein with 4Fe4S-binding SPASM domain